MGTITASQLITRARGLLRDPNGVQWTEDEMLRYLSDAQRAAVEIRPEINPKHAIKQLQQGTRQILPDGVTGTYVGAGDAGMANKHNAFSLIEIVRNMGADGATPGRSVRVVQRDVLDTSRPDWHSETATDLGITQNEVRQYVYDIRARNWFYVWPQQSSSPSYIEMYYSGVPSEIEATTTTIELEDTYQTVLLNYMMHRCYSMQINTAGSARYPQLSAAYYQLFQGELTGSGVSEMKLDPIHQSEQTVEMEGG